MRLKYIGGARTPTSVRDPMRQPFETGAMRRVFIQAAMDPGFIKMLDRPAQ